MKVWLAHHLNLSLLAVSFFSRLPLPQSIRYSPSKMRRASRYFPLVGWLIAGLLIALYSILQPLLGIAPSLCLMMITSLLLTGALHEDGLADICDGFWGGFDTKHKLAITKDSRIGTYGTCAIIMALLTKFILLSALAQQEMLNVALLVAYPLSRAMAITLVQDMEYVSNKLATSGCKSEPLAKPFAVKNLVFVLITGSAACWLLPLFSALGLLLCCLATRYYLRFWMNKHIQGYTGDCLGAAQQIQELLIYLLILISVHQGT